MIKKNTDYPYPDIYGHMQFDYDDSCIIRRPEAFRISNQSVSAAWIQSEKPDKPSIDKTCHLCYIGNPLTQNTMTDFTIPDKILTGDGRDSHGNLNCFDCNSVYNSTNLIACSYCVSCESCSGCSMMVNCKDCDRSEYCVDCVDVDLSKDCRGCQSLDSCESCTACRDSSGLIECRKCTDCKDSEYSEFCVECHNVHQCRRCYNTADSLACENLWHDHGKDGVVYPDDHNEGDGVITDEDV